MIFRLYLVQIKKIKINKKNNLYLKIYSFLQYYKIIIHYKNIRSSCKNKHKLKRERDHDQTSCLICFYSINFNRHLLNLSNNYFFSPLLLSVIHTYIAYLQDKNI